MSKDKIEIAHKPKRTDAIIPVIVVIGCLIPFVNKAFHMDDPMFIWAAKHIQSHPLDFYGFTVNWFGTEEPVAEIHHNPPAASYYIALAGSLFGWGEAALHIAFLIAASAAALGSYYLARQLCSLPVQAALATVLTPVFIVSSTNVMCDTMMVAFWVWAVFFWVRGLKTNGPADLLSASVLIAFCALTKYFGVSLLVLLAAYSVIEKRRLGVWVLFLLIPTAILAGYQWAGYVLYGRGLLWAAAAFASKAGAATAGRLFLKGLTGLSFTGGCIITSLFWIPLLWSRRILIAAVVLTILLTVAVVLAGKIGRWPTYDDIEGIRWGFVIQFVLMVMAGVNIFWLAGGDFWRHRDADSLLLLLWTGGTFIFAGFVNWTVSARNILPMVPAVGILLMRRIDLRSGMAKLTGLWPSAGLLLAGAVLSLAVSWADYTWANTARDAAAEIHKNFANRKGTLWFQGHWGFQYYMEAAGGRAIDFDRLNFVPGDKIITPWNNSNVRPPREQIKRQSEVLQFSSCRWLSTGDWAVSAGFYSDVWGVLPFATGPIRTEQYSIYTVKTKPKLE